MPRPDLDATARFLSALTGADGWRTPVTFQTFDDTPARRGMLAGILHGALAAHATKLARLNDLGAHIAILVNEGDLRGRKTENVTALRALFTDEDAPKKRPYGLPPSMLVRSARGEHAYWLLQPGEDLERFRASQKHLAFYLGTDPALGDLAHTMRIPGFWHLKAEAHPVELVDVRPEPRYTIAEILAAHPLPKRRLKPPPPPVLTPPDQDALDRYDAWAWLQIAEEGTRNNTAFRIAAEGFRRGFSDYVVSEVVRQFCARAGIEREAKGIVKSAARYAARKHA